MTDDYSNWHPYQQIAPLAQRRTGKPTPMSRYRRRRPRFEPTARPAVSPEQHALNVEAEKLQCPKGIGSGAFSHHVIGHGETACAFCGLEASTILTTINQLEGINP